MVLYHHDCESLRGSLDECRLSVSWPPTADTDLTKLVDLGCESTENRQLPSTPSIAIVLITQLISFYRPTVGGRLSRTSHCSKGARPVPRAVYCSSCRDNSLPRRDSNLSPLTSQSDNVNHSATDTCGCVCVKWCVWRCAGRCQHSAA